jgi:hypothetical protein
MKRGPRLRPRKPKLPRAPLPRQTGGMHEDKTKRPIRKQKHRKPAQEDE